MKLALLAILGFSVACSTVKNTSSKSEGTEEEMQPRTEHPAIRVLYGVRPPVEEESQPSTTEQPAQASTESEK